MLAKHKIIEASPSNPLNPKPVLRACQGASDKALEEAELLSRLSQDWYQVGFGVSGFGVFKGVGFRGSGFGVQGCRVWGLGM